MIENIVWLGHGGFMIQTDHVIYINPWKVTTADPSTADVILISHHHYEHFSMSDITRLATPHTHIISNERVAGEFEDATVLRPWHSLTLERTSIKAVPAYSPTSLYHPKEDGGLGFIISSNFFDIYYAGDTQRIPEMDRIFPDIAILPIDGNGTMNISEAVDAIRVMRPRWVIPSNWGKQVGGATSMDVSRFREEVGDLSEVVVPNN